MRSTMKTTQKMNGRDFWAWVPLQPTVEAPEPHEETVEARPDSWDGPTFEDLRMTTTQEHLPPTVEGWAVVG